MSNQGAINLPYRPIIEPIEPLARHRLARNAFPPFLAVIFGLSSLSLRFCVDIGLGVFLVSDNLNVLFDGIVTKYFLPRKLYYYVNK